MVIDTLNVSTFFFLCNTLKNKTKTLRIEVSEKKNVLKTDVTMYLLSTMKL